jgi:hypothetical protein
MPDLPGSPGMETHRSRGAKRSQTKIATGHPVWRCSVDVVEEAAERPFLDDQGALGLRRTIYATRYLVDETYQRRIGRQLNKGENLRSLRRDLAYAVKAP